MSIENDLSLYSLKNHIAEQLMVKVDKQPGKTLSDNNFTDNLKEDIINMVNLHNEHPHVPMSDGDGLFLKSTTTRGQYTWGTIDPYRHENLSQIEQEIHITAEERRQWNRCITADTLINYYNKGETESRIYEIIADYNKLTSANVINALDKLNELLEKDSEGFTVAEKINNQINKLDEKIIELNNYKFTDEHKNKLNTLKNYVLPAATTSVMGGVYIGGTGITLDASNRLAVDTNIIATKADLNTFEVEYDLPIATNTALGGIKVAPAGGLVIDTDGSLSVSISENEIINNLTTEVANKLNKGCIITGTGIFNGGITLNDNEYEPAVIINVTGKAIRSVSITPTSDPSTTGSYWYGTDSDNNILVYNTGQPGSMFSFLAITED